MATGLLRQINNCREGKSGGRRAPVIVEPLRSWRNRGHGEMTMQVVLAYNRATQIHSLPRSCGYHGLCLVDP